MLWSYRIAVMTDPFTHIIPFPLSLAFVATEGRLVHKNSKFASTVKESSRIAGKDTLYLLPL